MGEHHPEHHVFFALFGVKDDGITLSDGAGRLAVVRGATSHAYELLNINFVVLRGEQIRNVIKSLIHSLLYYFALFEISPSLLFLKCVFIIAKNIFLSY